MVLSEISIKEHLIFFIISIFNLNKCNITIWVIKNMMTFLDIIPFYISIINLFTKKTFLKIRLITSPVFHSFTIKRAHSIFCKCKPIRFKIINISDINFIEKIIF
ncbi:hypothetical protein CEW81_07210 [Kluyvera genomosp. 3]|uniref:Uncharacterized protein n=1 Tax=Kluyvera genomosp. 3 TaxID=2774055 RepID=A0A248KIB2_9ENTR|nr:hypothetical protein CEW81_07210 [Kluyvera genomosp. 3]